MTVIRLVSGPFRVTELQETVYGINNLHQVSAKLSVRVG
jgi:hypothetical protein